jgi:hypothetical protein
MKGERRKEKGERRKEKEKLFPFAILKYSTA